MNTTIYISLKHGINITSNTTSIADYLNKDIPANGTSFVAAVAYREHTISQTYTVKIIMSDIDLEFISYDTYDFGVLSDNTTTSTRAITPAFP